MIDKIKETLNLDWGKVLIILLLLYLIYLQ